MKKRRGSRNGRFSSELLWQVQMNVVANDMAASSTDVPTIQMTDHQLETVSVRAIGAPKGQSGSHLFTSISCDQSAVPMGFCAGLAGAEFTLLPRSSTACRTTDGEYLFWTEWRFHDNTIPQKPVQK